MTLHEMSLNSPPPFYLLLLPTSWNEVNQCICTVLLMAEDIYSAAVSIAARLLTRRSDKYLVPPGPAIYPAAVFDGFSRLLSD